jgi:hypothetical protein
MSDHKTVSILCYLMEYFLSSKMDTNTSLAENIHNLLEISSSPSVSPSLRIIPTKYNIIFRLWIYAFHKLLESLCRAAFASPLALEHLRDFIYITPRLSSLESELIERKLLLLMQPYSVAHLRQSFTSP